jgi:hypothetical protein
MLYLCVVTLVLRHGLCDSKFVLVWQVRVFAFLFHENPEFDPLENVLKRSRESTTPALESSKYFTVVIHHLTEADGIGTFRNEATSIEFSPSMS